MMWQLANRADPACRDIADRHYNRQSVGAAQFVPPGRCVVLYAATPTGRALWVTSWPFGEFVKHRWPGAWICSAFRNEGAGLATELIRQALAVTRYEFGEPPELGLVTFLDRAHVQPIKVRGAPTWGRTWRLAGFEDDGETKGGLMALRLRPDRFPQPEPPLGSIVDFFA